MRTLSKILVIDTATKYIYLSLIIDGIEKQNIYQEGINNHSVTIIPLLDEILTSNHITLQDIDDIIVGIGPGSYTGVRIGVTVAKMIGYLNKINVFTISSLALIASASKKSYIIPYVDARRGNAFMAAFKYEDGIKYVENDVLENIESFRSKYDETFDFIAEGIPDIQKILKSKLLKKVDNIHELTPNYLRITEAERNKIGNTN